MSKAREKREEPVFDDDADKERWSAIVRAATASLIAKQQQQQRQLSSAAPESAAAAPAHVAGQETDRTARRKAKKEAKKASKKAALTNPSTDSHSLPNGGDNDASKMKAIIQSARADVQKKAVSETAAAAPSPAASKTSSALPGLWPSSQKAIAGQAPSERQVVPSASASKKRKRASETIPQATKTLQLPAQVRLAPATLVWTCATELTMLVTRYLQLSRRRNDEESPRLSVRRSHRPRVTSGQKWTCNDPSPRSVMACALRRRGSQGTATH